MRKYIILAWALMAIMLFTACKTEEVKTGQDEGFNVDIKPEGDDGQEEDTMKEDSPEGAEEETTSGGDTAVEKTEGDEPIEDSDTGDAELEEAFCDESASLGYISCEESDGELALTIKNSGRTDLEGVSYRFYDSDMNLLGEESELFEFSLHDTKDLIISTGEYTGMKSVDIHPVQSGEICVNKQLVLIPSTNCR
ncbi:MAG: hypothetical protein R6U32_05255 [Candidatus Woesearchaeota archaeon]